jgi:hypothetical protein
MNRMNFFQVLRSGRFYALVVLVGLGLVFTASGAKAGCGLPYKTAAAHAIPFVSPHGDDSLNQQDGESNEPASIVGLWHVIYTLNSGGMFAESFKTWHGDGTEWENAFFSAGADCYGVWKDLGHGSVKLHHIGLMFNVGGDLVNIFTVDETNTVAPNGKTYSGHFDFKLWPPSFAAVGVGVPEADMAGTTAATRITVD